MKDYTNKFASESLTDGTQLAELKAIQKRVNELFQEIAILNNKILNLYYTLKQAGEAYND